MESDKRILCYDGRQIWFSDRQDIKISARYDLKLNERLDIHNQDITVTNINELIKKYASVVQWTE